MIFLRLIHGAEGHICFNRPVIKAGFEGRARVFCRKIPWPGSRFPCSFPINPVGFGKGGKKSVFSQIQGCIPKIEVLGIFL
jgi:hypothetical protein